GSLLPTAPCGSYGSRARALSCKRPYLELRHCRRCGLLAPPPATPSSRRRNRRATPAWPKSAAPSLTHWSCRLRGLGAVNVAPCRAIRPGPQAKEHVELAV